MSKSLFSHVIISGLELKGLAVIKNILVQPKCRHFADKTIELWLNVF